MDAEDLESSFLSAIYGSLPWCRWSGRPSPARMLSFCEPKSNQLRRHRLITLALDMDESRESPDNKGQQGLGDNTGINGTRLGIILRAAAAQVLGKLNAARMNFPTKIFLLLLGFYTANALATILGQTGDWDVLVAGIVVAAIEGIGMLMYRKPFSMPVSKWRSFIGLVNYWKAGVCLGLFVDAFKLGS